MGFSYHMRCSLRTALNSYHSSRGYRGEGGWEYGGPLSLLHTPSTHKRPLRLPRLTLGLSCVTVCVWKGGYTLLPVLAIG